VTLDGEIAWALLTEGGGQWIRAGIDGTVVGLDLARCLARPRASEADPEALDVLLLTGEAVVLEALASATRERG
jgi:hypothetical protein